ncbi:hypothetical protein [Sphingobacterium paludis]|uniref:Uncharacterized protein n=1 Tax=Sphingobacterium paludis TaxID=1476465 RepID=A0A4R7D2V4_9SPHI|nr:hypothetical protein [Sphingobacterium paludis]TDS14757.1 hypothetical protein B0I21_103256 [Sphingobacterium paludis]
MDKLTLEHISPYLAYGLRVLRPDGKTVLQVEGTANGLLILMEPNQSSNTYGDFLGNKPILRPLSDLTKEIEHNGEIKTKIEFLVLETDTYCDAYQEWLESFLDNPEQSRIVQAPYEVFNELVKEHFDVFGLIAAGLAVDMNTLEGGSSNG